MAVILITREAFTVFSEPEGFVVLCQLAPGLSRLLTFLFVGSQIAVGFLQTLPRGSALALS